MSSSLLSLFRTLASFTPPRGSLAKAPWEDYVDWAVANGLGPLASYNLEYRLGGGDAPEWARDRLLSVYSGTVNDNVMKLVTFKRAVDDLQGRRILMLGGATFADGLYPHVAFRPVLEIKLRVEASDMDPFAGFLKKAQYKPLELDAAEREGADRVLSDDHAPLFLYTELLGPRRRDEENAMLGRALPVKVYGPSVFRPDLEDAILLVCLEQARAGYVTPMISFVDLRELALGQSLDAGALGEAGGLGRGEGARSGVAAGPGALRVALGPGEALPGVGGGGGAGEAADSQGHPRAGGPDHRRAGGDAGEGALDPRGGPDPEAAVGRVASERPRYTPSRQGGTPLMVALHPWGDAPVDRQRLAAYIGVHPSG